MQIVINSSPLIFLAKLGYLEQLLESSDNFYIPQAVVDEVGSKSDSARQEIRNLISFGHLKTQSSSLTTLINSLNQRLGRGESEAIALGIELNADYILLDDSTARREAGRLGLTVKGTLAVIKKLTVDGKIDIENLDQLYQKLIEIEFRVKRTLFDQIFGKT